jgi:aspartyl-tRNA(Asn)/glutamyl-tRNA(Gln) amidotransferase subunit B
MALQPVIGIEIHAQLNTKTKLFCRCQNSPESTPNINTCPICLGLPGALPAFNEKALQQAVKAGLALNCRVNEMSEFARKNYFYPDLPKGYQITQFDKPICEKGHIKIDDKEVRVRRVHIEEDAGKITHGETDSFVDFNRAGVPLIEIVTEPDIESSDQALKYMKSLRLILKYLGVCDCDMEKGNFRCEANVSLEMKDEKLGVPVELKNLNSFKAVKKAIEYEVSRQSVIIKSGKKVMRETRGWNDLKGVTFKMREKEESHDYRYFPEPDLPTLRVNGDMIKSIRIDLPELPHDKKVRYQREYALSPYDSELISRSSITAKYFEEAILNTKVGYKRIANLLISDIFELSNEMGGISKVLIQPKSLAKIAELIDNGSISTKIAKIVIRETAKTGLDPVIYIKDQGLLKISDPEVIKKVVESVMKAFPNEVSSYRSGKLGLLGFFVGQVMKETDGKADPEIVNELLKKGLG